MDVKARIQFNTTRAIKEEPKTLTIGLKQLNHGADFVSEHTRV